MFLFLTTLIKCEDVPATIETDSNNISLKVRMYPTPYTKNYILEKDRLLVVLQNKNSDKDSLVLEKNISISQYDSYSKAIKSLNKNEYNNKCINDGLVFDLTLNEENETSKNVRISNTYNDALNNIILFINSQVDTDNKLYYDKEYLNGLPTDCE